MPRTFLYRCPDTGQNVQGWSADEATDDDDTYQSFPCIACTPVHLVNLKTGKVLGEDDVLTPKIIFGCPRVPRVDKLSASGDLAPR